LGSVTERSPEFGLTDSTRKPATIAAGELSRAIATLAQHHEDERPVCEAALTMFRSKLAAAEADPLALQVAESRGAQLEGLTTRLRDKRAALLDVLASLRAPLADVMLEAHHMLPPDAVLSADVEPHPTPDAPRPIGGLDPEWHEELRVVEAAWQWSRDVTYTNAARALGPAYLLSYVIEHPASAARALRADATAARVQIAGLLAS
jgi:hypothetical protein